MYARLKRWHLGDTISPSKVLHVRCRFLSTCEGDAGGSRLTSQLGRRWLEGVSRRFRVLAVLPCNEVLWKKRWVFDIRSGHPTATGTMGVETLRVRSDPPLGPQSSASNFILLAQQWKMVNVFLQRRNGTYGIPQQNTSFMRLET